MGKTETASNCHRELEHRGKCCQVHTENGYRNAAVQITRNAFEFERRYANERFQKCNGQCFTVQFNGIGMGHNRTMKFTNATN